MVRTRVVVHENVAPGFFDPLKITAPLGESIRPKPKHGIERTEEQKRQSLRTAITNRAKRIRVAAMNSFRLDRPWIPERLLTYRSSGNHPVCVHAKLLRSFVSKMYPGGDKYVDEEDVAWLLSRAPALPERPTQDGGDVGNTGDDGRIRSLVHLVVNENEDTRFFDPVQIASALEDSIVPKNKPGQTEEQKRRSMRGSFSRRAQQARISATSAFMLERPWISEDLLSRRTTINHPICVHAALLRRVVSIMYPAGDMYVDEEDVARLLSRAPALPERPTVDAVRALPNRAALEDVSNLVEDTSIDNTESMSRRVEVAEEESWPMRTTVEGTRSWRGVRRGCVGQKRCRR
jgi:hypothetical protein